MLTVAMAAFVITAFKYLTNGMSAGSFEFGTTDPALLVGFLTCTLGSYVARKWKSPPPSVSRTVVRTTVKPTISKTKRTSKRRSK
jgi:hypothetical protein